MSGVEYAAGGVQREERRLHRMLRKLADGHPDDADIHFVASDLATWSETNARLVSKFVDGTPAADDIDDVESPDAPTASVALLQELQAVQGQAGAVSLAWEVLRQIAQAKRRQDVLDLVERCQSRTLRQMKWATTSVKTVAPQALASLP